MRYDCRRQVANELGYMPSNVRVHGRPDHGKRLRKVRKVKREEVRGEEA